LGQTRAAALAVHAARAVSAAATAVLPRIKVRVRIRDNVGECVRLNVLLRARLMHAQCSHRPVLQRGVGGQRTGLGPAAFEAAVGGRCRRRAAGKRVTAARPHTMSIYLVHVKSVGL
jgi:hypothetical protein